MELGRDRIRVNTLCPGSVEGPRIDRVIEQDAVSRGLSPDEIRSLYKKQNSMRVLIQPEQIAQMVAFLCSEEASFVTGVDWLVDGGGTQPMLQAIEAGSA